MVGQAGSDASADLLVGGCGTQGVLGLVPDPWWMKLGPKVSGGFMSSACAQVCGDSLTRGWALYWVWPCLGANVVSGVLVATCLLVDRSVSLPS